MIKYEALFRISYGLYIVSSGTRESGNAYISNTVFQVTAEPPRFASCCHKENYTVEYIKASGAFSVSVLDHDAEPATIRAFGYKSGKDTNKLRGMDVRYGETGVPIVLNDSIAYLEFRVEETIDLGTHLMFIGTLIHSEVLDDDAEPLTYLHYRKVNKGMAPKNAPTYIDKSKLNKTIPRMKNNRYECPTCGHIYDEEKENVRFEELPDDWVCPVCGEVKSEFVKQ